MKPITAANRELVSIIYREMRSDVFAVFRRACVPECQCWDMTQDVFERLMKIDLLDEKRIRGMVFTIAYRMRTDYFRHRAFVRRVFADCADAALVERVYNADHLEAQEIRSIEMHVVSRMSDTDRRVYCMDRIEEKTAREIALELNLTCRAVENRLYRTRKTVRETLKRAMGF